MITDADGLLAARFGATRDSHDDSDWRDVLRRTSSERRLNLRPGSTRRFRLPAVIAVALISAAFAFPSTRGPLERFFGGGPPPGGSVAPGSFPVWLTNATGLPVGHPQFGSERLLAEQDGQRLLAYRDGTGRACLVFGNDSDTCSDSSEWERLFTGNALVKLASGVGPTSDNRVAVFGIARPPVVRVEIRDGDRTVAEAPVTNGAWVITAKQAPHDTLVGLDVAGNTVESVDARGWTWKVCLRESGCQ